MTERQKRNRAFIALAAALTITAASGFYFSKRQPMQAQTVAQPAQTNTPRGTRINPKVTLLDEPEWRENVSLEVLGRESKAIVIGKPIRGVTKQSANGNEVTINFDVQIQEAIKGDLQPNATIKVSMPGGLIKEADGTLHEFRTPRVRKMTPGKIYALFLKAKNPNDNLFTLLRGSQGIYEIPANGTRVVHLGRSFDLPPADDGPEINAFLQTIRAMRNNR
jgi:hypothetical protein